MVENTTIIVLMTSSASINFSDLEINQMQRIEYNVHIQILGVPGYTAVATIRGKDAASLMVTK